MRKIHGRTLVAALLACGAAACGGPVRHVPIGNDLGIVADVVPLKVRNNYGAEMNVFILLDGTWRRIGFVPARSSGTFELGAYEWTGAPLRILATTLDGREAARSEPLTALPGQTVTFTIEADLALSSATVR